MTQYPEEFLERLKAVTGKRARIVVDHILAHGSITTEELATLYGYKHAPRAVRDVREQGIPLETFSIKNEQGQTIAAYRFGNLENVIHERLGGRKTFSKAFKKQLIDHYSARCVICGEHYEDRYLQVDHRVPYQIAGDIQTEQRDLSHYMLVCGSCNRAKSWSCEHCPNWTDQKSPEICHNCYWASPDSYQHIALRLIRRLDVTWSDAEVLLYEKLKQQAVIAQQTLPDFVKAVLKEHLEEN